MVQILDLRGSERDTLRVILPDNSEINVTSAAKTVIDSFGMIARSIVNISEENTTVEEIERHTAFLFEQTARILSHNIENRTITKSELEDMMTLDKVTRFLVKYSEFLRMSIESKN